jgi:hypothetical protein
MRAGFQRFWFSALAKFVTEDPSLQPDRPVQTKFLDGHGVFSFPYVGNFQQRVSVNSTQPSEIIYEKPALPKKTIATKRL